MNQLISGFIGRVFRLRIEGNIDQKLADSITRGLQKSWPYKPQALLVTINSPGGSLVQAKSISSLLRIYSNHYNVPIVTFVEDQCLGSANLLLTTGVKCYANAFSTIGDVGYVWDRLWLNKFAQKYDVKQEYIFAGENKMKPQSEKWIKNYMFQQEHQLKLAVISNRQEQFAKNNLGKEAIEQNIFSSGIIDPQNAIKYGLIDGIRNLDQEISERYSSVKLREINKIDKSWKHRLSAYL